MDFESRKNEIAEEIFAIEDFENVDEKLMEKINENDEYRKLFFEARNISELVKSSVPTPEKYGVSLHDAVMNRVKDGDTLPRYIKVRRSYPFATAACLLIVFAVVFVARSGIAGKFANKAFDSAADEAAIEAQDFEYYKDGCAETENGSANPETAFGTNTVMFSKHKSESNSVVFDEKAVENSLLDTAEEYRYTDNAKYNTAITEDADEEIPQCENFANVILSDKVISVMESALELGALENSISSAQIFELGEELYIEWFETICESDDFANLYTLENFKAFCEGN